MIGTFAFAFLTGCVATERVPGYRVVSGSTYVSMGSSFAAGAGIGPKQHGSPQRCNRSTNNYASIVAERLNLNLTDVSCSGAKTDHVLGSWNELPAQINALKPDTALVTVTIGGNDLNYVGRLFASSCRFGSIRASNACTYGTEPSERDYDRLERQLRLISAEVQKRAPRSRLIFIQYMTLLSDVSCQSEAIASADAAIAKDIAARLSLVTRNAARATKAELLHIDSASKEHTSCSERPWINAFPKDIDRLNGTPWHPNATGHAAIADFLEKRLKSGDQ